MRAVLNHLSRSNRWFNKADEIIWYILVYLFLRKELRLSESVNNIWTTGWHNTFLWIIRQRANIYDNGNVDSSSDAEINFFQAFERSIIWKLSHGDDCTDFAIRQVQGRIQEHPCLRWQSQEHLKQGNGEPSIYCKFAESEHLLFCVTV